MSWQRGGGLPFSSHRLDRSNVQLLPLERAVARVCQEAGARVARNVRLADMHIDVPVSDERRVEVVANGLSLRHGSQQAVDATIVGPVTWAGGRTTEARNVPKLLPRRAAGTDFRAGPWDLVSSRFCALSRTAWSDRKDGCFRTLAAAVCRLPMRDAAVGVTRLRTAECSFVDRMPLPICHGRCGPTHGCGAQVDRLGDHALVCPRTGLLARRAKVIERAWVRVAREAVGAEGQVVPQQWLVHTTAPGVRAEDRRRRHLRSDAQRLRAVLRDATLVSPLTRTGQPQPCAADVDGAALRTAERRKAATYPELQGAGPQKLRRTWKRSRRALSTAMRTVWYETWFGYGLTEHRRLYGPQRLQAGRVAGGACCLSQCSKRLPALPSRV